MAPLPRASLLHTASAVTDTVADMCVDLVIQGASLSSARQPSRSQDLEEVSHIQRSNVGYTLLPGRRQRWEYWDVEDGSETPIYVVILCC